MTPDLMARIEREHPHLVRLLDLSQDALREAEAWLGSGNEFEDDASGRGDSYRAAQRTRLARVVGIRNLMRHAGCLSTDAEQIVVDVFGGDGVLADVCRALPETAHVRVITGDASRAMVLQALAAGLPAVRQPAQRLLLRSDSTDVVLMAYGTHHLPVSDRARAFGEARRVLKPGGRLVVHDYDEMSMMARWFSSIVDRYSPTGHQYDHFSVTSMGAALHDEGFIRVKVSRMYDPFRISGPTARSAVAGLADHIGNMYGLRPPPSRQRTPWILAQAARHFRVTGGDLDPGTAFVPRLTVRREGAGFCAELPRVALVAVGEKPLS